MPAKDEGTGSDSAPEVKHIFTTATLYQRDLKTTAGTATGLEGADALCGLAASAAGLGGIWKAWISDATTDAIDRIQDVGALHLLDGTKVFNNWHNLATVPLAPINVDENGNKLTGCVWTNTSVGGRKYSECLWDLSFGQDAGATYIPCGGPHTFGYSEFADNTWTKSESSGYLDDCRLYCIQQ